MDLEAAAPHPRLERPVNSKAAKLASRVPLRESWQPWQPFQIYMYVKNFESGTALRLPTLPTLPTRGALAPLTPSEARNCHHVAPVPDASGVPSAERSLLPTECRCGHRR